MSRMRTTRAICTQAGSGALGVPRAAGIARSARHA